MAMDKTAAARMRRYRERKRAAEQGRRKEVRLWLTDEEAAAVRGYAARDDGLLTQLVERALGGADARTAAAEARAAQEKAERRADRFEADATRLPEIHAILDKTDRELRRVAHERDTLKKEVEGLRKDGGATAAAEDVARWHKMSKYHADLAEQAKRQAQAQHERAEAAERERASMRERWNAIESRARVAERRAEMTEAARDEARVELERQRATDAQQRIAALEAEKQSLERKLRKADHDIETLRQEVTDWKTGYRVRT